MTTISGSDLLAIESLRADVARLTAERDEEVSINAMLRSEADVADKALAESAAHWEALIASGGQFCGHCRTPIPLDEMRAHIRACPSNPMVADLASRDATIAELRGLLEESSNVLRAALSPYPVSTSSIKVYRQDDSAVLGYLDVVAPELADRIDAALGKEQG